MLVVEAKQTKYMSSVGEFYPSEDISSGLFGKSMLWGNGHDTNLEYFLHQPNSSSFPDDFLDSAQLKSASAILPKFGWPSQNNCAKKFSRLSKDLSTRGFLINEIKKGKFQKPIDTKISNNDIIYALSKHIRFIGTKKSGKITAININDGHVNKEIYADFLILSAGGLGNVVLLTKVFADLNIPPNSLPIGIGYSNHPKFVTHSLHFKKRIYLGNTRSILKKWKPFEVADLIRFDSSLKDSDNRNLRVSLRFRSVNYSMGLENIKPFESFHKYLDKILVKLGWTRSVDVMCYFEMPQKKSNYIKFIYKNEAVPVLRVEHKFSESEKIYIKKCVGHIGSAFKSIKYISKVQTNRLDFKQLENMDSSHYLGTTRMASSSNFGVTNFNSLVYGTKNIYCAGTSVIPISYPNHPTWMAAVLSVIMCNSIIHKGKKLAN